MIKLGDEVISRAPLLFAEPIIETKKTVSNNVKIMDIHAIIFVAV
jgi:hypothetical protein